MNTRKGSMIVGLLLCLVTVLAAPQGAMAVGTPACTDIGNIATVNFNVGGAPQAPVSSATNTITVGNRVDVIVTTTDAAPGPSVVPNQADVLLHYTITNNGNASQRYAMTAVDLVSGVTTSVFVGNVTVTDAFSAATYTTGDNVGGALVTTATVAESGTLNVTIRATMPVPPLTNDWYAVYALRAVVLKVDGTTVEADSAGSTITSSAGSCSAAVVLGDGAGTDDSGAGAKDGSHSARSAYHVQLTTLTVNKSSVVYWDPFNLFLSPKAIPGAIMQYSVAVTNSGGAGDATNVAITDTLTGTLAPVNPFTNANCAACAGACIEHPAATFVCAGSWAGQTLSATDATNLVSGATTTFVYQATIQ